ncbi:hypothetical protein [Bradyrhizobium liaoningense]|uniref:hypothetical protein n=1 Tax=Bradyrhizobium liaoningense TaxID=43992 RepID=UPI001BA50EF6|nr:hypothetical protein [Bradyrhizobium liaoningense]MBR0715778.1 hypothetical protein [Bradyrhizobium liaoningense]
MGRLCAELIKRGISPIAMSAVIAMVMSPAPGRDLDGRYRNSPLHEWFESLASGKGLCCSYADGHAVEDVDWESRDGHYRVRLPEAADSKLMIWVDVPDDAIITVPNRAGRTMVWPVYNELNSDISIRCFMPGSMT